MQSARNSGATVTDALYLLAAAYCAIAWFTFVTIWRLEGHREWPYALMYALVSIVWGPLVIHYWFARLARRL